MPDSSDINSDAILKDVQATVDAMFAYLRDLLYDPQKAELDVESLPEVFQDLGSGLLFVGNNINEARNLANDLAKGNLNSPKVSSENEFASGLKNLQSTLKHISWQVGQVAKGDFRQKLSFAGEFSESINGMIEQLRERDDALRAEIQHSNKLAEEMAANVEFFEAMSANMTQWIVVFDKETKEVLYTNHQASDVMLDVSNLAEARCFIEQQIPVERSPGEAIIIDSGYDSDRISVTKTESGSECILELTGTEDELSQYFSGVAYALTWREKEAIVFVFTDVSDEQRERELLENVAYFDALTGTYSRHYGMQLLDKWLATKEQFAISFVDMDSLKFVNDTFGHNDGDIYIMAVCNTLKNFDHKAKICRLGGDEFMLLCKGWSKEAADARLEELRTELGKTSDDRYLRSISYGVVEVDKNNTKSGSLLLSEADEIMYQYKRARKMQRRAET